MAASLLLGAAVVPLAVAGAAIAQEAPRQASFSIPAQPLGSALAAFGRQAGMQVSVDAGAVRGRTAEAVTGMFSSEEALDRLLAGTGLTYRIDGRTVIVTNRVAVSPAGAGDADVVMLETIDVTAGSGSSGDAPYMAPDSSSHISSEQIDRVPTGNPADILKSTPGVISAGNRVGPSMDVNIRGLQGQSRVNVMIDGTRQSSGSYRGYRGSRSETYVDPDFLSSVDVTKGPSGGAGGVGAMGGVVNMRTLEVEDVVREGQTYGVRVKGSLGSNTVNPPAIGTQAFRTDSPFINGDAWNGNIAAGVSTENVDFVAGFSRRKSGNYFAGSNGDDTFLDDRSNFGTPSIRPMSPYRKVSEVFNTSQDVTSFLAKGTVRWGDGHSLKLGYINYQNNYGENYETLLGFALSPTLSIPAEQFPLSRTVTNTVTSEYRYDPAGNPVVDVSAHLWATNLHTESMVVLSNSGGSSGGDLDVRTYGGDVTNTSIFDTAFGAVTMENGAEFVFESARSDQIIQSYPWGTYYFSPNPNGDRTLASIFNRTRLELTDYLTVSGGLRYDYYQSVGKGLAAEKGDQSADRLSPQVAVTVEPVSGLQLFGSYSGGWRPPSLREQTAFSEGTLMINPDLRPETSQSFEFGLNYLASDVFQGGDRLRFKAVRFDNDYRDYIARGPRDPLTYEYKWFNIDHARFRGVELAGSYDAGVAFVEGAFTHYDDVSFCNGGTCGFGVIGTDYGVMTIPPRYTATLTAGIRALDRKLTLGARGYFIGERYGGYKTVQGAVNAPVYYAENVIVDIFGSYEFSETSKLDFSVENITDRYYLDPLAGGLVPAPGRTIRVGFTAKF